MVLSYKIELKYSHFCMYALRTEAVSYHLEYSAFYGLSRKVIQLACLLFAETPFDIRRPSQLLQNC